MKTIIIDIKETEKSKELQELLFSMGYFWNSQENTVQYIKEYWDFSNKDFIIIKDNKLFFMSDFSLSEFSKNYILYNSPEHFMRSIKLKKILKKDI